MNIDTAAIPPIQAPPVNGITATKQRYEMYGTETPRNNREYKNTQRVCFFETKNDLDMFNPNESVEKASLEKIKEIKEVCAGALEYGEHILPQINYQDSLKVAFPDEN